MKRHLSWTRRAPQLRLRIDTPNIGDETAFRFISTCLGFVLVLSSPAFVQGNEVFERALEASLAAESNLKSSEASGTYLSFDGQETLQRDIRFRAYVAGDKFHLDLHFRPVEGGSLVYLYRRQILVYDGSAVFVRQFPANPASTAQDINVYKHSASAVYRASNFFYDLSRVQSGVIHLANVFEKHGELTMEPAEGDRYRGTCPIGQSTNLSFDVSANAGYHVVHARSYSTKTNQLGTTEEITWKNTDGVWHVESVDRLERRGGKPHRRIQLQYDQFQPNVPVSPKLFTMEALEPADGTRIIDHPQSGQPTAYNYKPGTREKKLDSMLEQAKAMPIRWEPPQENELDKSGGTRLWWILGVNVVLVLAIALGWHYWRRKRRPSSS